MKPRFFSLIATLLLAGPTFARLGEVPVSDVTYGAAPYYQCCPSAASDGENFLVVWHDERAYPYVLYATRVNRNGAPLDPTGIRIPVWSYGAQVVFAGDVYVIVIPFGRSVAIARITRDGLLVDGPRVVAENVPIDGFTAASNGSRIVLAWRDRLYVLSAEGELLERDIPLPVPASPSWAPLVASNGSGFLLAFWHSYGMPAVQALPLDGRGHPSGAINTITTNGNGMAIASDGRDYVVIYSNINTQAVESRFVSADAKTIGQPFMIPGLTFGAAEVRFAWSGANYIAISRATALNPQSCCPTATSATRLDAEGRPLDSSMSPVATAFQFGGLAVASNGRDVILAWSGRRLFEDIDDIYALNVSTSSGADASGTLISRSATPQQSPAIAFSGRNYLVVWQEGRNAVFNRLAADGRPLDGSGIRLPSTAPIRLPRVVFDGENYVVAWIDQTTDARSRFLKIVRVAPDSGSVIDNGEIIGQSPYIDSFDMAVGDQAVVVVWSDGRIHAARLNRDLQMLDLRRDLSPSEMSAGNPAVAWNGTEWLITFDEQFWYSGGVPPFVVRANVRAIRLSALFTLLDPQPLAVAVSEHDLNEGAQIASDGNEFLIVWLGGPWTRPAEVHARHMKNGIFLDDPATLANGTPKSAVWDGTRYAIAYLAARTDQTSDALLTHAGRAGELIPNDLLVISATADDENSPRLVVMGNGNVIATYTRVATEPLYGGVSRAFVAQPSPVRQRPARPH